MSTRNKPLIIATTAEQFAYIEKKLEALPDDIIYQIETAKVGHDWIDCTFRKCFDTARKIILPAGTIGITAVKDEIQINAGGFVFRIPSDGTHPNYQILK